MRLVVHVTKPVPVYADDLSAMSRFMSGVKPDHYDLETVADVEAEGHPLLIAGHLRAIAARIEEAAS